MPPGQTQTKQTSGTTASRPKVPIARLTACRPGLPSQKRVAQACNSCRVRKTKCDSHRPWCNQCVRWGIACVYSDSKRTQARKMLVQLRAENDGLRAMLRDIVNGEGNHSRSEIGEAIAIPRSDSFSESSSPSPSPASSVVSMGSIDTVSEDWYRSQESGTGYIGRNAEIARMRSLQAEIERLRQGHQSLGDAEYGFDRPAPSLVTAGPLFSHEYDQQLPHLGRQETYSIPPKAVADLLLHGYFDFVGAHFPIIRQGWFVPQYQRFMANPAVRKPNDRWLAVLNLVFAISARHWALSRQDVPERFSDRVFFERAKSLGLNENVLSDIGDLQQVQVEALAALYFVCTAQTNRAWKMIRIASSSAIGAGINMRSFDRNAHPSSNEARCRLWCSIFILEYLLTVETGRPSGLDGFLSVNAPLPFEESSEIGDQPGEFAWVLSHREEYVSWTLHEEEAQTTARSTNLQSIPPNPSLYFFYLADLSLIGHGVVYRLYGPRALQEGWGYVQSRIREYSQKLDTWPRTLHRSFRFQLEDSRPVPGNLSPEQIGLAMNYYSLRIVLTRPCLSRPDFRRYSGIPYPQSRFSYGTATMCVRSALSLLAILPDEPTLDWVYTKSPWWKILDFLKQAMAVLLVHLSDGSAPITSGFSNRPDHGSTQIEDIEKILAACAKGLRWLHTLATTNSASRHCFDLFANFITHIASARGFGPSEAYRQSIHREHTINEQFSPSQASSSKSSNPPTPLHNLDFGAPHPAFYEFTKSHGVSLNYLDPEKIAEQYSFPHMPHLASPHDVETRIPMSSSTNHGLFTYSPTHASEIAWFLSWGSNVSMGSTDGDRGWT